MDEVEEVPGGGENAQITEPKEGRAGECPLLPRKPLDHLHYALFMNSEKSGLLLFPSLMYTNDNF